MLTSANWVSACPPYGAVLGFSGGNTGEGPPPRGDKGPVNGLPYGSEGHWLEPLCIFVHMLSVANLIVHPILFVCGGLDIVNDWIFGR